MKPTTKLLASAPNETEVIKLIARYWCTKPERITLEPQLETGDTFAIYQGAKVMFQFRVRVQRSRYRFEYFGDV